MFLPNFSFCRQPTRNKMPIKRVTTLPIISIGLINPTDDIDSATMVPITQATPRVKKIIPPTKSFFQDIIKITNKTRDGRLCINNPINISLKFEAESKTSRENIAKNSANKINNILGVQNMNLLTLVISSLIIFNTL